MQQTASKDKQVRNMIVYLIPVAVGNLIPLLTFPILTRVLTKEDFGLWALAQVYALVVSGLANFGLTVGYERNFFEHRDPKGGAQLLYTTLAFVLSAFAVFLALTFVFRAPFAQWIIGDTQYGDLLFWTFAATGAMSLKTYYLMYFRNREDAKPFIWCTIGENVLVAAFTLALVVYFRTGVLGLVWGQLLASTLVFSILAVSFLRMFPFSLNWPILKESLKLSVPLTPRIFFGVAGSQFDKYMIGLLSSIGGVGIYSIGQRVANIVFTFMTAIQNVFAPQVYQRMFDLGERGRSSVGVYLTPFAYVSVFAALLIALFSEEVIFLLSPEPFWSATDVVIILSMFYGSLFFGKHPQLIYAKKTYITSILTLVSIALNIAINIPFILTWGTIGAAWGTFSAGILSGVVCVFF
jgi:O-antigen/teichoic acid export membrane protein